MTITLDSSEFIPTQREEIRREADAILDDFMEPLMQFTIVQEIKQIALAANMPQGFIDGVKFQRTGPNKGDIINVWGTKDKPLAIYFNYGTSLHWIEPTEQDGVLAFPATDGKHARAIYFQGEPGTDTLFSKGHYVSGVPRTEAMERGFNIGKKRLAQEAGRILEKELNYEPS